MPPIRVVIANSAEAVIASPVNVSSPDSQSFATVHATTDIPETVARLRAQLAVVDLEVVSFSELGELCKEFPATAFVCTHRLADDAMWARALAAGAVDCCLSADLQSIVENANKYVAIKEAEATAAA
jgi:hypothetical protein